MNAEPEAIVEAYLRFQAGKRDEDRWAWDAVETLVDKDPDAAWRITCMLIERANSDDAVALSHQARSKTYSKSMVLP
jgi:hypothetical protein